MNSKTGISTENDLEAPAPGNLQPHDEGFVEYGGVDDMENPKNWSSSYKWSIVALISFLALT